MTTAPAASTTLTKCQLYTEFISVSLTLSPDTLSVKLDSIYELILSVLSHRQVMNTEFHLHTQLPQPYLDSNGKKKTPQKTHFVCMCSHNNRVTCLHMSDMMSGQSTLQFCFLKKKTLSIVRFNKPIACCQTTWSTLGPL